MGGSELLRKYFKKFPQGAHKFSHSQSQKRYSGIDLQNWIS